MEQVSSKEPRLDGAGEVKHDHPDAARRELLAKMGRFAYVAPALVLLAEPKGAHAGYGRGGSKPGWGFGDKNHKHSGPPGLKKKRKKK
jgi:hypothetical protein